MESTVVMGSRVSRELRWLADAYEQAQRIRIETGERIRAVLQGRDETFTPVGLVTVHEGSEPVWVDLEGASWTVEAALEATAAGDTPGPVPILGRTYHRHYTEERELFKEMTAALHAHPAWPWLDRVRGIGPTLACKLLARFDVERADHASSFWAYCGLATVPADVYRCATCGIERAWPTGYNVTGKHQPLGKNGGNCKGVLELVHGPKDGARCAQPRAAKGEKRNYDAYAKKVMYLVATSFLKAGGPYEELYRRERAKADRERVGWADGRKHFLAMRKVQKLFLSHLWQVWREAVGLPVSDPWVLEHGGHEGKIEPWDMVKK